MHVTTSSQPRLDLGFHDCSCNWGVHICGLYETPEERDEIVVGLLRRGELDGDLQLYCPCERTEANFREEYDRRFPGSGPALDDPQRFRFLAARDLYYPDGTFSPRAMDEGLAAFYADSQSRGPRHVRATAEMVWALEAIPGVEHLMAYESRLNYFIPGKPWVSVCLYNLTRFDGATIMQVLRTHPFTVTGGTIAENPYYQPPDEWLARYAPQFLGPQDG